MFNLLIRIRRWFCFLRESQFELDHLSLTVMILPCIDKRKDAVINPYTRTNFLVNPDKFGWLQPSL